MKGSALETVELANIVDRAVRSKYKNHIAMMNCIAWPADLESTGMRLLC